MEDKLMRKGEVNRKKGVEKSGTETKEIFSRDPCRSFSPLLTRKRGLNNFDQCEFEIPYKYTFSHRLSRRVSKTVFI